MWNLDDDTRYEKVLDLDLPWATTWADTRDGHKDKEKRERIRERATIQGFAKRPDGEKWAFRISVSKCKRRAFDIENVAKPIIDAFCTKQIHRDNSQYKSVGLYPDDRLDHVVILEVAGTRSDKDSTRVEIFAVRDGAP